jgi:hypothetical protein
VRFAAGVVLEGDVIVENSGPEPREVAAGVYRNQTLG